MSIIRRIISDKSGQGLVEYSLILTLVALAAIGAMFIFGESLNILYESFKEDVIKSL